jgi:hypothetical protein
MRRWENIEVPGRGTKYCLVMDPEDGTHPIRTYGWTVEEVLDKVAKTAETAQQVINRQRSVQAQPSSTPRTAAQPARPALQPLTADQQMQATADLSNPAKAPEAIKTLLRGAGVDVDGIKLREDARQAGAVAQEWERQHPDFPSDERNQRMLMDKALLLAGGKLSQITAAVLDQAFQELLGYGMFFEPANHEPTPQPNAPDGNPAPVVRPRGATSVRSNALRATTPVARQQPKYTRAEIDAMNSKQLADKIKYEPGFLDWYNREFSAPTA